MAIDCFADLIEASLHEKGAGAGRDVANMDMVDDRHAAELGEILVEKGSHRRQAAGLLQPIGRRAAGTETDQFAAGEKRIVASPPGPISEAEAEHPFQISLHHGGRRIQPERIKEGEDRAVVEQKPFRSYIGARLERFVKRQLRRLEARVETHTVQVAHDQLMTHVLASLTIRRRDRRGETGWLGMGDDDGVFHGPLLAKQLSQIAPGRFAPNQGCKGIFRYSCGMDHRHLIVALLLLFSVFGVGSSPAQPAGDFVGQFYQQRADALAWSGEAKANAHAQQALTVLSHAAQEGLDPESYRVFREGDDGRANDASLSRAVLTYMRDVSLGRPELRSVDRDIGLSSRSPDFAAMLNDALRQDRLAEMLAGLAPKHPGYLALKAELPASGEKSGTIIANMERWRWLPAVLEPDRIMVNAAGSELELWLGGKLVLTSRVIVGRASSPTPILRAEGAGLTVNPPWTVPRSIAAKEILPKLKRNHAWLASHDMVLLNGPPGDPQGLGINWRAIPAGTFPYQIRQYPGPRNPLGQIKLELPNRFDVYLHDTPDKAAFGRASRQLSHGCVRVEQILPLASYALAADLSGMQQITQAIASGKTTTMPLQKKLPVYFLYWTAVPGPGTEVKYHADVYGRDRRLIAAMRAQQPRIARIDPACTKG